MEQGERFDTWGIAEVMGHKRFAGRITEQTIAGAALVRVDVPEVTVQMTYPPRPRTVPAYTKLIGVGSIYCITPTTEEVARLAAVELAKWDNSDPIPLRLPAAASAPTPDPSGPEPDDDILEDDGEEDFDGLVDAYAEEPGK